MKKLRKASNFIFVLLRAFFRPFLFFKYGLRFDRTVSKTVKRPCFIVSNHTTVHDQFIVGIGFKFAINFVASDSLFRKKWLRDIMHVFAKPIPIAKGASDPAAIKNIMTVIKDGGAVGIFPEGNRTFFGSTGYFKPTIGKLVKKLKVPLVIVNIRGGFNTAPRWRKKVSKGRMSASVTKVVSPEELCNMTDEQINDEIARGIDFNEYEYNAEQKIRFRGEHKAEYLESALFYCPECGSFSSLESHGNDFYCKRCGAAARINEYGLFEKISNSDKLPKTVLEWSELQLDAVKKTDFSRFTDKPAFFDDDAEIYLCERAKKQKLSEKGRLALYANEIRGGSYSFPFEDVSDIAIHGIRKLQIYLHDGRMFMIKVKEKTNLVKYMVCGYRILHEMKGEEENFFGY